MILRRLALLCLLLALAWGAAAGDRRVALVIGNGAYGASGALRNPPHDAADMAEALEALGFEVTLGLDLDRRRMLALIDAFAEAAQGADAALFYYAGHGLQIDARNYLVPVDAVLRSVDDVSTQTVRLDTIAARLAAAPGTKLIFLDACRDNPLAGLGLPGGAGARPGLARVGDAAGFLFAFATQPDNVAEDGAGRNSPFAAALLSHINTPGQDIASTMISVRKDVLAATGGQQVPWENSSLTRQFQFAPGAETASPETLLWQVAVSTRDPTLARLYLERYPEGAHVADLGGLVQLAAAGDDAGTAVRALPAASPAPEETLWDLARRMRLRPLVEIYLRQNPSGRFADEARRLLASLPDDRQEEESPELLCERLATHPRDATANVAGVLLATLAIQADRAIQACAAAVAARPQSPHYVALLARALAAAGRRDDAIARYRDAAERGDLRAMTSLGLILEMGDGLPRDPAAAAALYARAADRGSPDGAINLAVMLITGAGVPRDPDRAVALLAQASAAGSALATYNLGVLAQQGLAGPPAAALDRFRAAADLGEPRGYLAAAILLDEGRGVAPDPASAADMLLQGVAADSGESANALSARADPWSRETIRALQARLQAAGFYAGQLDGRPGPKLAAALAAWRKGGYLTASTGLP